MTSPNTEISTAAPKILAIETSGRLGSIALGEGSNILATDSLTHGMRHAVALLPMIQKLTQQLNWQPQQINHIYVSTGPGSFTGLRIAIAVARALHLALGCKLVAVPTLDATAANAPANANNVVVILDAKRAQVFAARYRRLAPHETPTPDELPIPPLNPAPNAQPLVRVAGPELVDPAQFLRATPHPITILGEGIDYHRPALQAGVDSPESLLELDRSLWAPSATMIYHLGYTLAQRNQFTPMEQLLPVYIRLPEAEEVWRKKNNLPIPTPLPTHPQSFKL